MNRQWRNAVRCLRRSFTTTKPRGASCALRPLPISCLSRPSASVIALINYGIVGLIQLNKGFADTVDIDNAEAMRLYDQYAHEALELMKRKNHDYDEAWRGMRVSSYTDLILTKIERIKEIENLGGETLVSEGIDANYMDIINYAVFGVIKLSE